MHKRKRSNVQHDSPVAGVSRLIGRCHGERLAGLARCSRSPVFDFPSLSRSSARAVHVSTFSFRARSKSRVRNVVGGARPSRGTRRIRIPRDREQFPRRGQNRDCDSSVNHRGVAAEMPRPRNLSAAWGPSYPPLVLGLRYHRLGRFLLARSPLRPSRMSRKQRTYLGVRAYPPIGVLAVNDALPRTSGTTGNEVEESPTPSLITKALEAKNGIGIEARVGTGDGKTGDRGR